MGFKCGIVGMPNVGKSTLFNALTRTASAQAANYPFCTIEPNTGDVAVPDPRLSQIAKIAESKEIIPTKVAFVDIAGLVKGASKGEGLGNQFLANIREVDAILHVLRCFENDDITHVEGRIDPTQDADLIETELMLADLESLEKRIDQTRKKATAKDKESLLVLPIMESALSLLQQSKPVRELLLTMSPEELILLKSLNLLTARPVLYISNVGEEHASSGNDKSAEVEQLANTQGAGHIVICASFEEEIAQLPDEEQKEFLSLHNLDHSGLSRLIRTGYNMLSLITYFTAGPKETRGWTIPQGTKAPRAAGVIHTDFEKGFIRAQTISFDDYIESGSELAAKEAGKARDEGKEYEVADGDIILFKFNT